MRISDYIEQAGSNLWKKKLRTFLTTAGVVIGIAALVSMFAFGQGIQRNITDRFNELDLFNYINVFARNRDRSVAVPLDPDDPDHTGAMNDSPAESDPSPSTVATLDTRFLDEVMQIEGVVAAFPEMRFPAQIRLGDREEFTLVQVLPPAVSQSGLVQLRAGSMYSADEPNELIVSGWFLRRRLGVRDPEAAVGREIEVATLTLDFSLGRLLRMAFSRGDQSLPFARESYRFRIAGVAERMRFGGGMPIRSDVYLSPQAAEKMRKLATTSIWDFFKPAGEEANFSMVSVKVRSPQHVAPVKQELESRGYRTFALMDQLEEMRTGFLIMDMFLIAIGMIGITVASLGIVNTMVMSILERYREIGIMKAVGATDGDVQRIFLFESGVIGLLGGLLGLLLAVAVSFVINEVINALMARQHVPRMAYFDFPWWLCAGAVLFSILISLIAGIYPTLRAARVDPVVALRHD
jgi:ABC-type lipoprotein release transport system permease subunit